MATRMPGSLMLEQKPHEDFNPTSDRIMLRRPEEGNNLRLTLNDQTHEVGRIASAFPLSSPMETIVFFDQDGEEIGVMEGGSELEPRSRRLLQEELEKAYFMPRVEAIVSIEQVLGVESWTVRTDKGERTFEVRDPRRNVRKIDSERVLVKDVDGNRYEIPSWYRLDRKSLALLMRHL